MKKPKMKHKNKHIQAKEGSRYILLDGEFIHTCCNCGVEHRVKAEMVEGKVGLRWFPHKEAPKPKCHLEMVDDFLERMSR